MTLRRQWLIILTLTAVLAIGINSVVLSALINRYFQTYTTANYNKALAHIRDFSQKALVDENYTGQQLISQLTAYLNDPITRIRLYDADGRLLADTGSRVETQDGTMGGMMGQITGGLSQKVDNTQLSDYGTVVGRLSITRYDTVGDSLVNVMFRAALIRNSLYSFGIVLAILIIIGLFVSRRMSRDLSRTADMALQLDLGERSNVPLSKVREIRVIQQSLAELKSRLKLRQVARKRLVDELVHQTRTPLTILKTHLEAMQDGIIGMTPETMQTCEAQIENLSSIIYHMRQTLDAEQEDRPPAATTFEFGRLIKKIMDGLRLQFEKKQIALELLDSKKAVLKTDQYKLSQSIYNILTNAYKFTEPGGKVTVSYELTGEAIVIQIEDTGIGIGEEDQKHLFGAYYKGSAAHDASGDGLGLYVARQNLHQIHGEIAVASTPGRGSRFTIRVACVYEESSAKQN
ncbi:MAG: HAMP domain-containing sensor histidine kinase [Ethanoligenens sp.]|uniref:sensor histidine kinase n=1 Tax=Ethanoligenens sp. TaxID=2099655 RepID=UPI0039E97521